MSENNHNNIPVDKIRAYCETQPIERLSELGADFNYWLRPNTDIGFVVDYVPGASVSLLDLAGHEIDLSEILGIGVVVHTTNGLRGGLLERYLEDTRLIYARNS